MDRCGRDWVRWLIGCYQEVDIHRRFIRGDKFDSKDNKH